jgi:hypothetical protein
MSLGDLPMSRRGLFRSGAPKTASGGSDQSDMTSVVGGKGRRRKSKEEKES